VKVRKEVSWFAEEHMERRLTEHDGKKIHWIRVDNRYLLNELGKKFQKLCSQHDDLIRVHDGLYDTDDEIDEGDVTLYAMEVLDTAADIANYSMMVADKVRVAVLAALEDVVSSAVVEGEEVDQ